jgi:hypothetical protein
LEPKSPVASTVPGDWSCEVSPKAMYAMIALMALIAQLLPHNPKLRAQPAQQQAPATLQRDGQAHALRAAAAADPVDTVLDVVGDDHLDDERQPRDVDAAAGRGTIRSRLVRVGAGLTEQTQNLQVSIINASTKAVPPSAASLSLPALA